MFIKAITILYATCSNSILFSCTPNFLLSTSPSKGHRRVDVTGTRSFLDTWCKRISCLLLVSMHFRAHSSGRPMGVVGDDAPLKRLLLFGKTRWLVLKSL